MSPLTRTILSNTCHAFRLHSPYLLQFNTKGHSLLTLWRRNPHSSAFDHIAITSHLHPSFRTPISNLQSDTENSWQWYAIDVKRDFVALVGSDETLKWSIEVVRLSDGIPIGSIPLDGYEAKCRWRTFDGFLYGHVSSTSENDKHSAIVVCTIEDDPRILNIIRMPELEYERAEGEQYDAHIPLTSTSGGGLLSAAAPFSTPLLDLFHWKNLTSRDANDHRMITLVKEDEDDGSNDGYSVPVCTPVGENEVLIAATRTANEIGPCESVVYLLNTETLEIRWKTVPLEECLVHRIQYLEKEGVTIITGRNMDGGKHSTFIRTIDMNDGSLQEGREHMISHETYGNVAGYTIASDTSGDRAVVVVLETGLMNITPLEQFLSSGFSQGSNGLNMQGEPVPEGHVVRDADVEDGVAVMLVTKKGAQQWTERELHTMTWVVSF